MYELAVESEFAAAHRLEGYSGLCENLHGHNWKVMVQVRSAVLNNMGMVMDFKDLKASISEIMEYLDHKYLNDIEPFNELNPTTENIARYICEKLEAGLPQNVHVERVQIWESARASAAYIPRGPKEILK
ncbi:MAG: 6-carboxytetrahydropterin synthase QueD [Planctomycetota bacterium]|jgi:6-pyruvoyltetrahydropterin/6-carboxytetrahydropterin synthase